MRWAWTALLLLACSAGPEPIRVGVKGFDEQRVLGALTARILKDAGLRVDPIDRCGDTYECHRRLRTGRLDLLVEYTGTGWVFAGREAGDGPITLEALQGLYDPLGLRWLFKLGFDNGYRVIAPIGRGQASEPRTLSDLAKREGGLRVACPSEYLRRPVDGLAALTRRYGLRLAGQPLVLEPPDERVQAVVDGRADVAVVYATDGGVQDPRVRVLNDPLGFFPPYEAAMLARAAVLEQIPSLEEALRALSGRIDEATMRRMNHAVQREGRSVSVVVERFLHEAGLFAGGERETYTRPDLEIALHEGDALDVFSTVAARAARRAYPKSPVRVASLDDPVQRVVDGRARLAVLGAERFFELDPAGPPRRDERLEAVAVLGGRALHLVRRSDDPSEPLSGRIGIGPRGSGSARAGEAVLSALGASIAASAELDELLRRVTAGELDAALVLAEAGLPELARGLSQGALRLRPIALPSALRMSRLPWLRIVRIPAGTYPGQASALDSLGCQVVLAGPGRARRPGQGAGGPIAALPVGGAPLSPATARRLADAAGSPEAPDPILPTIGTALHLAEAEGYRGTWLHVLLNGLTLAFLGWLAWLLMRREERTD
jgi:glycine betaine/choline ABC-type transport system substrate-binding protein